VVDNIREKDVEKMFMRPANSQAFYRKGISETLLKRQAISSSQGAEEKETTEENSFLVLINPPFLAKAGMKERPTAREEIRGATFQMPS